jgi:hypothetical protein
MTGVIAAVALVAGGVLRTGTSRASAAADAQLLADLGRLTVEELREYRRLEAKTRGSTEAGEIQTTKASETPIGQEPPADSKAGKTDGDDNGCTD